jgi:hypothetical protein
MATTSQLITPITNFEQLAELEVQVQEIRLEIMDKVAALEDQVFDLDSMVIQLQDEVALLRQKTVELQTTVDEHIESYGFIIQSIMLCIILLFMINWINK